MFLYTWYGDIIYTSENNIYVFGILWVKNLKTKGMKNSLAAIHHFLISQGCECTV